MTFVMHLCCLGDAPTRFGVLFCIVVLGADTHFKLRGSVVSGVSFLTGGVFECDLAHLLSMAISCMLYKIRCNPMHPLYGTLPESYLSVRVIYGAVIAYRYICAPPRGRTS